MSTYNQQGQNVGRDQYNIGGDAHFHGSPTPTPTPTTISTPVPDFTGREAELADLTAALATGGTATVIVLCGMGGIGKSQLAFKLAHDLKLHYPKQVMVSLLGSTAAPLAPTAALQRIIQHFAPAAQLPDDLPSLTKIYQGCLADHRQPVLVLADDAANAVQTRPLLPPPGCALIVTSRHSFTLRGMHTRNLDTLAPADAEALLLTICPRIGGHAADLAKLCGYLPLALCVSASLLENMRDIPIEDIRSQHKKEEVIQKGYLTRLQDERLKHLVEVLNDPSTANDPQASVEASFALSYATLPEAAQQTFAQLSVFAGSFDLPAAQQVVLLEELTPMQLLVQQIARSRGQTYEPRSDEELAAIAEQMSLLLYRSLLSFDEATARYSQHDLLRDYGRARLPAEAERAARTRHARYYADLMSSAQFELYLKGKQLAALARFDQERQQTDAVWRWLLGQVAGDAPPPADAVRDQLILAMANATVETGDMRYSAREQIFQLEAQAAAARRLGRKVYEGNALGNLGDAHRNLGAPRTAIDYYKRGLAIAREIRDRRGEGTTLGNLGIAHAALGELHTAIKYFEQSLAIAREIDDQHGKGNALGNLGSAHADLGEPHKSIEYMKQVLVLMREIGDRRGEGNALGNLGLAHADLGDARTAIVYCEQWLAIAREIRDQRGEGNALEALGLAYQKLDEIEKALGFHNQAMAIRQEIGDVANIARHSWNLGTLYEQQGDLAQAAQLMQVAAEFYTAIGHAQYAQMMSEGLARVRARVGGGE